MAVIHGYQRKMRILCAREFQNSLKESSFAEVAKAIRSEPWLESFYEIGQNFIRGANGTEFIFVGLARNIDSVKSIADIDLCIVEEAEQVTEQSWQVLIPTIRKDGSEIWVIWNPKMRNSATDERFRLNPPDNAKIVEVNWRDNPWFPKELEQERLQDQDKRPATYNHIWEGGYLESTETHPFLSFNLDSMPGFDNPIEARRWRHSLYRVIAIDTSQCVGKDYHVMLEVGRDHNGKTYILDMYRTNTADVVERMAKAAQWVRRRRPDKFVIEDTSESRTFIDILKKYMIANDSAITITTPTASSRGAKEPYIVNWLEPLFQEGILFAPLDISDIIMNEAYSFDVTKKDNADDVLDTMASAIRYLKTPKKDAAPLVTMTNDPAIDRDRQKLLRALQGKRKRR